MVLSRGGEGSPDSKRAWRPWVVENPDGTLRMWYCGHDGTTSRILEAGRDEGGEWRFDRVALDVGAAGDTDTYGVEAPCVVRTPGGYLMAYAGFDGEVSRIHAATSSDGHGWRAHGPVLQRGAGDERGAGDPCLLVTGDRWWLFYTGENGDGTSRRTTILAAISDSGSSWDRIGPVLEPEAGEDAVTCPCVLDDAGRLTMFYGSSDQQGGRIALATSRDGVSWDRRGTVIEPSDSGADAAAVHTPCAVRHGDGSLSLYYAGLADGDTELAYEICVAAFRP